MPTLCLGNSWSCTYCRQGGGSPSRYSALLGISMMALSCQPYLSCTSVLSLWTYHPLFPSCCARRTYGPCAAQEVSCTRSISSSACRSRTCRPRRFLSSDVSTAAPRLHYHQLIGLEGQSDGLVNVHVQVAESDGELKFLHTVADGPCDDSYGVQVAALAGLPRHVVERSSDLLRFLEKQAHGAKAGEKGAPTARSVGQSSLLGFVGQPQIRIEKDPLAEAIKSSLSSIDPDSMSPRQAHDALYELLRILEGGK